jgi:hypothetical protein
VMVFAIALIFPHSLWLSFFAQFLQSFFFSFSALYCSDCSLKISGFPSRCCWLVDWTC